MLARAAQFYFNTFTVAIERLPFAGSTSPITNFFLFLFVSTVMHCIDFRSPFFLRLFFLPVRVVQDAVNGIAAETT